MATSSNKKIVKLTDQQIVDKAVDLIIEGKTYRVIAKKLGMKLSTMADFFARDEHSARIKMALKTSADSFADMAEQVLKDAKFSSNKFDYDLRKARELAQHYRWKSAKRNPAGYGDKLDVTSDGKKISAPVVVVATEQAKKLLEDL